MVNYHRILEAADPLLESEPDVATFRWQMELLANCFNVIPLYEAVGLIGTGRMPPRAVCITFDDGYRSVHDLALPILQELKLLSHGLRHQRLCRRRQYVERPHHRSGTEPA
ncbi:hypothetical protein LP420_19160 [Massilia sp. B-10]|nr:hypothetical protein LP420_19160 [Massilia sp. B-10]UUZ56826.1 hypothetical protein LP419_18580 [Massilia sp. H-1]